jgi:hypothetical protein
MERRMVEALDNEDLSFLAEDQRRSLGPTTILF